MQNVRNRLLHKFKGAQKYLMDSYRPNVIWGDFSSINFSKPDMNWLFKKKKKTSSGAVSREQKITSAQSNFMCPHTYAEAFIATTLCFREMSYKLSRHQGLNGHSPGLEKLVCSCRELLACSGHIVCLSLLIAFKRFSGQN